jgi:endoglucanase
MTPRFHSTLLVALLLSSSAVACGGGSTASDVVLDPSYYGDKYNYDNADTLLGRGINMGNYLEGDPTEGSWSGRLITQDDFALIKAAGFKTVRIPVRWSNHAGASAPYTIDPVFLARVKQVVDWALAEGLNVVVNTHHYTQMMDDPPANLPGHRARLTAIWGQLCDTFGTTSYPVDRVVFELLNEPNGTVGYAEWNQIVGDLTTLIWTTKGQSSRMIMIGTANWGGPAGLANLSLPAAANAGNTIITFHWYEPFTFTHQGAEWVDPPGSSNAWIGTPWRGTDADQQQLLDLLDAVTAWNGVQGRGFEIFMGEFGAYGKYAKPEYRKAWTAFSAREAEARGMSWAYWEFDQGFGAYDRANLRWRPEILDALVPEVDRP